MGAGSNGIIFDDLECPLGTKLLKNTNMKLHHIPNSTTFNDLQGPLTRNHMCCIKRYISNDLDGPITRFSKSRQEQGTEMCTYINFVPQFAIYRRQQLSNFTSGVQKRASIVLVHRRPRQILCFPTASTQPGENRVHLVRFTRQLDQNTTALSINSSRCVCNRV